MAKVARIAGGSTLLVAGGVMLLIPGPGLLAIVGGLTLLSKDIPAAARATKWLKSKVTRDDRRAEDDHSGLQAAGG